MTMTMHMPIFVLVGTTTSHTYDDIIIQTLINGPFLVLHIAHKWHLHSQLHAAAWMVCAWDMYIWTIMHWITAFHACGIAKYVTTNIYTHWALIAHMTSSPYILSFIMSLTPLPPHLAMSPLLKWTKWTIRVIGIVIKFAAYSACHERWWLVWWMFKV